MTSRPGSRDPRKAMSRNRKDDPPSLRLGSLNDVRAELARVYREARREKMPWQDATKACHILNTLARLIETSDIERRLLDLEQRESEGPHGHANGFTANSPFSP